MTRKSKEQVLEEVLFELYPKLRSQLQVRHVGKIKDCMTAWHTQEGEADNRYNSIAILEYGEFAVLNIINPLTNG